MFKIDEISKRESQGGFNGLRYAPDVSKMLTKGENIGNPTPKFRKNIFKTMDTETAKQFTEESVEFGQFLDHKRHLAGEKDVDGYEDEAVLKFDPVEQYTQEKVGHSSYDSGKYIGGMSGETRLTGGQHQEGRVVSMERPDPYFTNISKNIKIRS